MELDSLRNTIDQIDEQLVALFAKRAEAVLKVAKVKKSKGLAVYDPGREEEVYKRIKMLCEKNHLDFNVIKKIFVQFIDYCKLLENQEIKKQ